MRIKCRRHHLLILLLFILLPSKFGFALGSDSVIDSIQKSFPAIVLINAENFAIYRSQETMTRLHLAQQTRQGAGVIMDSSGIIVTNAHIVQNAGRIKVTLRNQKEVQAQVVSVFTEDDLAFIRITPPGSLSVMPLADTRDIALGSTVYNVGTSEIIRGSIAEGSVIGVGRKEKGAIAMVKINFAVYRGDSGGPVINKNGELLGLIVAGSATGGRFSIAIPASTIKNRYHELFEK